MIENPKLIVPPNHHGCDECNYDMLTQKFDVPLSALRIGADVHYLCDWHIQQLRTALKEIP